MNTYKINPEVIYSTDDIFQLKKSYLHKLKQLAKKNPRRRIRICSHKKEKDLVHEMLIVHERDCYVHPHKHINKTESFHIIEGLADILIFDNNGKIKKVIEMGEFESKYNFYYRLPENIFHTLLIKSNVLVFHEVTSGPFNRNDTILAPWAPTEKNKDKVKQYILKLNKRANLFKKNEQS